MLAAVARVRRAATDCADAPAWPLSDAEVASCLEGLFAAQQQVSAALAHVLRQAQVRDLPAGEGASGAAVWLRQRLRLSIGAANRLVRLAAALDARPGLDAAVCAGAVNTEQAAVIAAAVADLPAEAGGQVADKAEAALIGFAADFDPAVLGRLGERILAHVAPEVAERAEAEALARQERKARLTRAFTLTPTGDGRVRLTGWLEPADAATVTAALDPLCRPRRDRGDEERTPAQRRADALVEVCALALRTTELPEPGGDAAQVVVTVGWEALRRQVGMGWLDTGQPVGAAEVRRVACDAAILPAVLDGAGQVLDLGRSRRLISGVLRRALIRRDGGCSFPGCDRPARWCEGHHVVHWAEGGGTCLANAVLLCRFHHRVIHRGDWVVRIAADGLPEFIPPAWLDPDRRPRRNIYHRRE